MWDTPTDSLARTAPGLIASRIRGYPLPPPCPLESRSYMLFRQQNIDSRWVIRKIFRNKELGCHLLTGSLLATPIRSLLSRMLGFVSVPAVTVVCDEKGSEAPST